MISSASVLVNIIIDTGTVPCNKRMSHSRKYMSLNANLHQLLAQYLGTVKQAKIVVLLTNIDMLMAGEVLHR
jgi:hypothetical protein